MGSVGEIAIITAGACYLFATQAGNSGVRASRWLLIIALPMIGVEVIVDAIHAGDKIMQPRLQGLPDPMAWVLSGVCSIAAALALLFGVWPRSAATPEVFMLGLVPVAYWTPALHTGRAATIAFIISFLVAAGVWMVAGSWRGVRWFGAAHPAWRA